MRSNCPPTDLNNSLLFGTPTDQVTTVPNDTRLSANKWRWQCESKSTLLLAALVFAAIQCVKTMAHRRDRILPLMSRSHQVCHADAIPCADPGIRIPFFKDIATSFFSNSCYCCCCCCRWWRWGWRWQRHSLLVRFFPTGYHKAFYFISFTFASFFRRRRQPFFADDMPRFFTQLRRICCRICRTIGKVNKLQFLFMKTLHFRVEWYTILLIDRGKIVGNRSR